MNTSLKKGGRYSKKEQSQRREEVFRLHFEYGYSAREIAKMMKVNRNTINNDISYCHSKLILEYEKRGFNDWLNKQLLRLDSQRARLRKELDSAITLSEKLQIEKMIFQIDSTISDLMVKLQSKKIIQINDAQKFVNKYLEEMGHGTRFISEKKLLELSEEKYVEVMKILDESQH